MNRMIINWWRRGIYMHACRSCQSISAGMRWVRWCTRHTQGWEIQCMDAPALYRLCSSRLTSFNLSWRLHRLRLHTWGLTPPPPLNPNHNPPLPSILIIIISTLLIIIIIIIKPPPPHHTWPARHHRGHFDGPHRRRIYQDKNKLIINDTRGFSLVGHK